MSTALALAVACGAEAPRARAPKSHAERVADAPDTAPFREETASPEPAPRDPDLSPCGTFDAALSRAAARVLVHAADAGVLPDPPDLAFSLRAEGEPHVWPHAWLLSAVDPSRADVAARLERFLGTFREGGTRRCGVARRSAADGTVTIAVVAVDALADLAPLKTRARAGEWLTFSAELLVPASGAKVVVQGPVGRPRPVPTSFDGTRATATFAPDRPGAFTVQLVATLAEGPRPVLEAMVFADEAPPPALSELPAPGEAAGDSADAASALVAMTNAARASVGAATLARNATLDRVAEAHARVLAGLGHLAHDAGDGDPIARVRAAGLEPRSTGENVAHAATPSLVHRLLWASPSHRGNLLDARFDELGVGAVRGPDGSLWVCELFAHFD